MRLKAGCEIELETSKAAPLVAMLRPRSGEAQWVARESYEIQPFVKVREYEDGFGNLCQRMVAPGKRFKIRTEAEVEVADCITVDRKAQLTPADELPNESLVYLLPSRYCPSDKLVSRANEVAGKAKPGYAQVEAIRRFIQENIEYKYGVSDASTSALDTLKAGAGVCRDFAHIGLSMCRALRIPARMVVGYLYQLEPMDLHAWFEAYVGGRWYTFDATQREPRGGRIAVAYGRDAADVALITELGELKTRSMEVWVKRA